MINVNSTIAPSSENMSSRICKTGWRVGVLTVLSKSWTEKSRHKIRKNPKTEEHMIDVKTPIGALHDAL